MVLCIMLLLSRYADLLLRAYHRYNIVLKGAYWILCSVIQHINLDLDLFAISSSSAQVG